jgi:hypothetical protein
MNKPFIIALSLILLISCKKDDDAGAGVYANITTDLPQSTWKVSYFFENNIDETSSFSTFSFAFNSDGSVEATNDLFTETGTWRYEDSSNDSSDDDGIDNDEELVILFATNSVLDELSDDWHITSATASKIELYDISGGSGNTNYLTLIKE